MSRGRQIVGALLALVGTAAAQAQHMQIQFAEPVSIVAAPGMASFDAYGRRFSPSWRHDESRGGACTDDRPPPARTGSLCRAQIPCGLRH